MIIDRLEGERQKVLQAHYADAIPIDLMRQEMTRITRETAEAQGRLTARRTRYQDVQAVLDRALELAGSCQAQYRAAPNAISLVAEEWRDVYLDPRYGALLQEHRLPPLSASREGR